MDALKVWTAAELERLSPDERYRLVNDQTLTDLSQAPADFVERARAEGRRLLAERAVIDSTDQ